MLNKKFNRLDDSIDDASEELTDKFSNKFNNLESKMSGLDGNINALMSKAEKLENTSIPITLDIPSKSRKPFVNMDDDDDSEESEEENEQDGNKENTLIPSDNEGSMDESQGNGEDSDDTEDEANDNSTSNLATKADMQKLADYIKEQTEKSRPTIPKEAGIAAGLVGIGVVLKKYAMILGGRHDVFR